MGIKEIEALVKSVMIGQLGLKGARDAGTDEGLIEISARKIRLDGIQPFRAKIHVTEKDEDYYLVGSIDYGVRMTSVDIYKKVDSVLIEFEQ